MDIHAAYRYIYTQYCLLGYVRKVQYIHSLLRFSLDGLLLRVSATTQSIVIFVKSTLICDIHETI